MFSTASYSLDIRNLMAKLTKCLLSSTAWHKAICLSHLGHRAKTDLFTLMHNYFLSNNCKRLITVCRGQNTIMAAVSQLLSPCK